MAKFCREKGVLISVYEEKPRRRRIAASRRQQQHHHHQQQQQQHRYHYLYNDLDSAGTGKGYNRRAELLQYSRTLRESPQPSPAASTPLLPKPKPKPTPTPTPSKFQPPTPKTVAVQRKPSSAKTPTCLGDWKILIPGFIRSLISLKRKKDGKKKKPSRSGTSKMKALMKSIKVQKKRGFIPKLCTTLQKHR